MFLKKKCYKYYCSKKRKKGEWFGEKKQHFVVQQKTKDLHINIDFYIYLFMIQEVIN